MLRYLQDHKIDMPSLHEPLRAAVHAQPLDQHAILARTLERRGTCTINMRGLHEPLSAVVLARPLYQHAILARALERRGTCKNNMRV